MLAFLTGVIVGVPISLVSIKLLNGVGDINEQLIILDSKVEQVLVNQKGNRLPFEGRN